MWLARTILLYSASALLFSCQDQPDPELTTGKELYEYHCNSCHKSTGNGMFLKGVPYTKLKTTHIDKLKAQVKQGSGMMPSFEQLTEEQIEKIKQHMQKELGKKQ